MQCAKYKDAALKSNELNVKREAQKYQFCDAHATLWRIRDEIGDKGQSFRALRGSGETEFRQGFRVENDISNRLLSLII